MHQGKMAENNLNNSTIDKLIPEIFDQMRVNLNVKKTPSSMMFTPGMSSSYITTQSLLEESKALDKIIPVVENLEKAIKTSGPQHLKRIEETCISTNRILDTWIKIQSQAGYACDLMSSEPYLEYVNAQQKDEAQTPESYLQSKKDELADLKLKLEEKKRSQSSEALHQDQQIVKTKSMVLEGRTGTAAKGKAGRAMKKPTGIPRSTSRVSKTAFARGRAEPRKSLR